MGNIIEWDGKSTSNIDCDDVVKAQDDTAIGDYYKDGNFSKRILTDEEKKLKINEITEEKINDALKFIDTSNIKTKLLLDMISDEEKDLLKTIIQYIDILKNKTFNDIDDFPTPPY